MMSADREEDECDDDARRDHAVTVELLRSAIVV